VHSHGSEKDVAIACTKMLLYLDNISDTSLATFATTGTDDLAVYKAMPKTF
jgi:hypothetical protein